MTWSLGDFGARLESRMNTPGKSGEFWNWRFRWDQLTPEIEERLKQITTASSRG